jgi:hypothetical protein
VPWLSWNTAVKQTKGAADPASKDNSAGFAVEANNQQRR